MRHSTDVAGRHLAWLEAGQGQPLVLLHAFPLSADMWAPQLEQPPEGWRVIAPDLRGLGSSSGQPATSVDDHADDVLALMRLLGIERAAVGGLSMGGYVAFALYRRAAQRFSGLVLADTKAEADTEEAKQNRVKMQATAREGGSSAVADAMVPKLLGARSRGNAEMVDRVRSMILANTTDGIIAAIEALKTRPDSVPTLSTVACPTLVCVGADDELTPVAASETMARAIRGATLTIVPDSGHLTNLEQSGAFGASLREFLRTVGPSATRAS